MVFYKDLARKFSCEVKRSDDCNGLYLPAATASTPGLYTRHDIQICLMASQSPSHGQMTPLPSWVSK
ncbi:hypothetical protein WJX72_000454 [[Myrmecia] bisecta]|uniref:Uncharacterized protein n=1 Tax=[Myrmecia] bisecta TaxID=41462 RepID=A0AAW1PZ68_9CHLO